MTSACTVAAASGDPEAGLLLARAFYHLRQVDRAREALQPLLRGRLRADAVLLLGDVEGKAGRMDLAEKLVGEALILFRGSDRHDKAAESLAVLASIGWRRERYRAALLASEACIAEAELADDRDSRARCYLWLARILHEVGDVEAAERAFTNADVPLASPTLATYLRYAMGAFYHDTMRRPRLAESLLREAIAGARRHGLADVERSGHLHLADVLGQLGRLDEGFAELHAAVELSPGTTSDGRWVLALAHLHEASGARELARATLWTFSASETHGGWAWEARTELGRLHEEAGDMARAETAYREAIALAEVVRTEAGTPVLRSYLQREWGGPYEALFALLAADRRNAEALAVAEAMHARGAREQLASNVMRGGDPAARIAALEELIPTLQQLPAEKIRDGAEILAEIGDRELIAHVATRARVWGLRVREHSVEVRDLGARGDVLPLATTLARDPDRRDAAEGLGPTLFPPDWVTADPAPLYVLPAWELGLLPYAALRRGGRYLVEDRPLVLVTSFAPAAGAAATDPPAVFGDPRGDLPQARAEALAVASLVGARALVGQQAARRSRGLRVHD